jgi:protein-S-isoprenylcysteine O-methyltransferase Ste14
MIEGLSGVGGAANVSARFCYDARTVMVMQRITPVFAFVLVCWFLYAGAFLFRRLAQAAPQRARRNRSVIGIILVGIGFGIVWSQNRPAGAPLVDLGLPVERLVDAVAILSAAGSVWLTIAAIRTLGKQWNLRAALVEGHALVTSGPYRIVRHPIYLAMLGMVVATGLSFSRWPALLAGLAFAVSGTAVRVRDEESLLRAAFGHEFEEYCRAVPAFLPGIH